MTRGSEHSAKARDMRKVAMAASLGVAVLMLAGKIAAFYITGSTAILSDAVESVVHIFATAIAAASLWYAAQPPDMQHPYGHGKIAYFSGGLEGVLILLAALGIIYLAVEALIVGPELQNLDVGLAMIAALSVVNLALGLFLVRTGKKYNAFVLVANGHHVLTDMWTSLGVIVGVALVWLTGILWFDPIVALLMGLNIMWTAVKLIRQAYEGLMEKVDEEVTGKIVDELTRAAEEEVISSFHQLRHRRVNDNIWIDLHLLFPGTLTITEAHRRASRVESKLRRLFPSDNVFVTSHLEPDEHDSAHPGGHPEIRDPLNAQNSE